MSIILFISFATLTHLSAELTEQQGAWLTAKATTLASVTQHPNIIFKLTPMSLKWKAHTKGQKTQ